MNVKRGQIWYARKTYEGNCVQSGTRPFIIVSNNACNCYSQVVTAIPLTTKNKKLPTHCEVYNSIALCEQIQTINKNDLLDLITYATRAEMQNVMSCVLIQLGIL